eukprot:UC1_evm8s1056
MPPTASRMSGRVRRPTAKAAALAAEEKKKTAALRLRIGKTGTKQRRVLSVVGLDDTSATTTTTNTNTHVRTAITATTTTANNNNNDYQNHVIAESFPWGLENSGGKNTAAVTVRATKTPRRALISDVPKRARTSSTRARKLSPREARKRGLPSPFHASSSLSYLPPPSGKTREASYTSTTPDGAASATAVAHGIRTPPISTGRPQYIGGDAVRRGSPGTRGPIGSAKTPSGRPWTPTGASTGSAGRNLFVDELIASSRRASIGGVGGVVGLGTTAAADLARAAANQQEKGDGSSVFEGTNDNGGSTSDIIVDIGSSDGASRNLKLQHRQQQTQQWRQQRTSRRVRVSRRLIAANGGGGGGGGGYGGAGAVALSTFSLPPEDMLPLASLPDSDNSGSPDSAAVSTAAATAAMPPCGKLRKARVKPRIFRRIYISPAPEPFRGANLIDSTTTCRECGLGRPPRQRAGTITTVVVAASMDRLLECSYCKARFHAFCESPPVRWTYQATHVLCSTRCYDKFKLRRGWMAGNYVLASGHLRAHSEPIMHDSLPNVAPTPRKSGRAHPTPHSIETRTEPPLPLPPGTCVTMRASTEPGDTSRFYAALRSHYFDAEGDLWYFVTWLRPINPVDTAMHVTLCETNCQHTAMPLKCALSGGSTGGGGSSLAGCRYLRRSDFQVSSHEVWPQREWCVMSILPFVFMPARGTGTLHRSIAIKECRAQGLRNKELRDDPLLWDTWVPAGSQKHKTVGVLDSSGVTDSASFVSSKEGGASPQSPMPKALAARVAAAAVAAATAAAEAASSPLSHVTRDRRQQLAQKTAFSPAETRTSARGKKRAKGAPNASERRVKDVEEEAEENNRRKPRKRQPPKRLIGTMEPSSKVYE